MKTFTLHLALDNHHGADAAAEIEEMAAALGGTADRQPASRHGVRAVDVRVSIPEARCEALLDRLAESETVRMAVADTPAFAERAPAGFLDKVAAAQERADARFEAECAADRARSARRAFLERLSDRERYELEDRLDDARRLVRDVAHTSPRYPGELAESGRALDDRYRDLVRRGFVLNPLETRDLLLDYVALAGRYAPLYTLGSPHLMDRLNTAVDLVPAYARPDEAPTAAPEDAPPPGPRP